MKILSRSITIDEYVPAYLDLWMGPFSLTEKEKKVLIELLTIYLKLEGDGLLPIYINKLLFSTESRKIVRENIKISEAGLNNYFTQLKEKGVILEDGKELSINSFVVPVKEITFKFNII